MTPHLTLLADGGLGMSLSWLLKVLAYSSRILDWMHFGYLVVFLGAVFVAMIIAEATTFLRKRGSFLVVPSYNSPTNGCAMGCAYTATKCSPGSGSGITSGRLAPKPIPSASPASTTSPGGCCCLTPITSTAVTTPFTNRRWM